MFSLLVPLLLINTYSGSFGNPVYPTNIGSVGNDLSLLAKSCDNVFITEQIKNNKECTLGETNTDELLCRMFYDINTKLCNSSMKVDDLEHEFRKFISQPLEVDKACESAKSWMTSSLPKYLPDKKNRDEKLKYPYKCFKMCEKVLTDDSNFFCKYYHWGLTMLNVVVKEPEEETKPEGHDNKPLNPPSSSLPSAISNHINEINDKTKDNAVTGVNAPVVPLEIKTSQSNSPNLKVSSEVPVISAVHQNLIPQPVVSEAKVNYDSNQDLHIPIHESKPSATEEQVNVGVNDIDGAVNEDEIALPKKPEDKKTEVVEQIPNPPEKVEKEAKKPEIDVNQQNVLNKPALEDVHPKPDDEDLDSEEGRDSLGEIQDGDYQIAGEVEGKPNPPPKTSHVDASSTYNNDASQKEYYSNSIPDDFADDDDHFFPLFLTVIVFVVLMYVLYHNKSKVTKVVLGLIVEGRQPGRRRNSRGHAYKRLDTLEQAMSANTAAPPSKIIY